MNPSFTRFWARILVFVGLVLASGGVLLAAVALVIDMPWGSITGHAVFEVTLVAFFLALSGVLAGVPFIVLGQLVLVFIEMHSLLGRIVARLEGTQGPAGASPAGQLPSP
ncbi:MAG: hypothetical protein ACREKS_07020 [Candidatus Rokuibacteriota bacterium]